MPFTIERNDLSAVEVDAVVIAANEQLQISGGVGLTVALAAGLEELQAACDAIGFCPCGSAVATPALGLKAKLIVHAVGPVWQGGGLGEADFLRSAYDAALECAKQEGARSVALPLISAGTYGFPPDVSLAVARESIRAFLNRHDDVDVRLVLYDTESVAVGLAAYLDIAEYIDDHYVDEHPTWGTTVLEATSRPQASRPAAPVVAAMHSAQASGRGTRGPLDRLKSAFAGRRSRGAQEAVGQASDGMPRQPESGPAGDAAPTPAGAPAPVPLPVIAPETALDVALGPERADTTQPMPAIGPELACESAAAELFATADVDGARGLDELLDSLDAPFTATLLALIDERGMTDAQVYKRANMSRQLFSKIRSNADYRPTKKTALALAVALGLSLEETATLLARAGFALSPSSKSDVIVEYYISRGNYDIFEINEALYAFDQPVL